MNKWINKFNLLFPENQKLKLFLRFLKLRIIFRRNICSCKATLCNTFKLWNILAFIDASVRQCPRKMFVSTPFAKEKSIRRMQNVCTKIRSILIDFKLNNVGGDVAAEKCSMYEAMNYRYSLSNRHQRFWKYSQQIHRELKRINQRKLQNNFQKFVEVCLRTYFCLWIFIGL